MTVLELIVVAMFGLRPDWRPDTCERTFATDGAERACEQRRDAGESWARELAGYIQTEAERQGLASPTRPTSYVWFVAMGMREGGLEHHDVCPARISLDLVVSRTVLDEEESRERICWTYTVWRDVTATNCQPVLVMETTDTHLVADRCAYGEAGVFQVRPHEALAGQVVPATGETLPRATGPRRERIRDAQVNTSLAMVAVAAGRDKCCCTSAEDGTRTCDEECRADPARWVGAYNTGRCSGRAFDSYTRKLREGVDDALEYVCAQHADWTEVCGDVGSAP